MTKLIPPYFSSLFLLLFLTGCDSDGTLALSKTSLIPIGDSRCIYGGVFLETGNDDNDNGTLDADEVDHSNSVCNGAPGTGEDGVDGANALVAINNEAVGESCEHGGQKIDYGLDLNKNNTLDNSEITGTAYVCDGTGGLDGSHGFNSLVTVNSEPSGEICVQAGQRIDFGMDSNRNNILGGDEITSTTYVCNGVPGAQGDEGLNGKMALIAINNEPVGSHCDYGGQRIDSGLDNDGSNALDSNEVTSTAYICNGSNGQGGLNALVDMNQEQVGANCRNGGIRIDTGVDFNRNNVLDFDEITKTDYVCQMSDSQIGWQTPEVIESQIEQYLDNSGNARDKLGSIDIAMDKNGYAIAVWSTNQWMFDAEVEYTPGDPVIDTFEVGDIWVNHYIADEGWGEAQRFDTAGTDTRPRAVKTPKVIFNDDGSAVVVWVQIMGLDPVGKRYSLAARQYTPEEGWGEVRFLHSLDAMSASGKIYSLAFDENNDLLVYWNYSDNQGSFYYLLDRFTSSGWVIDERPMVQRALALATTSPLSGKVVVDEEGNIIVVGGDAMGGCTGSCAGYSFVRRYTSSNMGWEEVLPLHELPNGSQITENSEVSRWSESLAGSGTPDVAMNAAGHSVVVWWEENSNSSSSETGMIVLASHYDPVENSWSDAQFVSQGSGFAALHPLHYIQSPLNFEPQIKVIMTENGHALVMWQQIDKTRADYSVMEQGGTNTGVIHTDLWSNQYVPESGWGVPQRVEFSRMGIEQFEMKSTSPQEVISTWLHSDQTIWSNRYVFGKGWGEAERIGLDGKHIKLAGDGKGNAMTSWLQSSILDGSTSIYVNRYLTP